MEITTTATTAAMPSYDQSNLRQMQALELVRNTNQSFFLTGKAGTGKTTFLKNIQKENGKQYIVVAPTGIAAIVAGGVTIHSFFGLSLTVQGPKDQSNGMSEVKIKAVKACDAIIIDEVSMVRCDIIDAIDRTLKTIMHNSLPFGGKQMIFSGDMFQLPPVLRKGPESDAMKAYYGTDVPFFFKAHVFKHMSLPTIEFEKIYRQEDLVFKKILNNIRNGFATSEDLFMLNRRVMTAAEGEQVITLTPRKDTAAKINEEKLAALSGEEFNFTGVISGKFGKKDKEGAESDDSLPAPMELSLKVGAQVMFTRNDHNRRWVNGTIGEVCELSADKIKVRVEGEDVDVEPVSWEAYEYEFDKSEKKLQKEVCGTYTQYPMRLAWAITIHKSQGLTFDRMTLDLSRGTFAAGQLYVALSRVRSLEGLYLSRPIGRKDIMKNDEVIAFASNYNDDSTIETSIEEGKALFPYLKTGDYDGAAREYLRIAMDYMGSGDQMAACKTFKKMFNMTVCDEALMGSADVSRLAAKDNVVSWFNNAVLCLYGNDPARALHYIGKVLESRQCYEALFIKSRALFMLQQYGEADAVNVEIMKRVENGEAGPEADIKFIFATAQVNEKIGDPFLGYFLNIISARPKYLRAHVAFHRAMHSKGVKLSVAEGNDLPELCVKFNEIVDSTEWEKVLTEAMATDSFREYARCLRKQNIE